MALDTNAAQSGDSSTASAPSSTMSSGAAGDAMERAESLARQAGDYASRTASTLASEAQGKVSGLLQGQMEAGASYVSLMSDTANAAARNLDDKAPELARLLRDVAGRTDRFADNLRHRSPDEIIDMAANYARENPRVFVGGAIAMGFLLSRILKSAPSHEAGVSEASATRNALSPSGSAATGGVSTGAASVRTTGGASYAR